MTAHYRYTNAAQSWIFSSDGFHFPVESENLHYQLFLEAGATPEPYVEPEKPPEPSLKEKLERIGITLEDLKAALETA